MQIGKFSISSPIVLAPMAGITDAVFRSICYEMGAGLTVSEMVSADTSLYASDKTQARLAVLDEQPRSVQIVGSDPDKLAQAAVYNVKLGADIIDINMGCPAKKVCKKLAGSALLADPELVRRILRAVVNAVDVPVTLKIRTGIDRENINGGDIALLAEREGVQAIVVHGRTRADKFNGNAEYATIREIKQALTIPVIANGDIRSGRDAKQVLAYTGADAVMVGRASQGNPWFFRDALEYFRNDKEHETPHQSEIHEILVRHLNGLYLLYGEYRGVRIARKHIAWYCREKKGVAAFRQTINRVETAAEQLNFVDRFFEEVSVGSAAGLISSQEVAA